MIDKNDIQISTLKISTPLVSLSDKAYFLQNFVHPAITFALPRRGDILQLEIKIKNPNFEEKLLNRVGYYLKTGTISLGNITLPKHLTQREALQMLNDKINEINVKFDLFVRSSTSIMNQIQERLKNGIQTLSPRESGTIVPYVPASESMKRLNIHTIEEQWQYLSNKPVLSPEGRFLGFDRIKKPLPEDVYQEKLHQAQQGNIEGKHPDCKPHDYQLEEILEKEKFIRHINGFNVGLGKTLTALLTAQLQLSLHLRNRVLFVVPNSTLSKWYKDAFVGSPSRNVAPVFAETEKERCLFLGLKNESVNPFHTQGIDTQLTQCFNPQYNKIFMTNEVFERLLVKEETLQAYITEFSLADQDFAEFLNDSSSSKGKMQYLRQLNRNMIIGDGKSNLPIYFEDLNIDMIVFDELHVYKNSVKNFKANSVRYLSMPDPSNIGIDAQIKTFFVRNQNEKEDGIYGLTATPFTNSPLEIYGMLSLVAGVKRLNQAFSISSLQEFMDMICIIENEEGETIDDKPRTFKTFKGLNMLHQVRNVSQHLIKFLNVEDVGLSVVAPDIVKYENNIVPTPTQFKRSMLYKRAYQFQKVVVSIQRKINALDKMIEEIYEKGDHKSSRDLIAKLTAEKERYQDDLSGINKNPVYQKVKNALLDYRHENPSIIGQSFNLLDKCESLTLTEDVDEKAMIFFFPKTMESQVKDVIDAFNLKNIKEQRTRHSPHTDASLEEVLTQSEDDEEYFEDEKASLTAIVKAKLLPADTSSITFDNTFEWLAENDVGEQPFMLKGEVIYEEYDNRELLAQKLKNVEEQHQMFRARYPNIIQEFNQDYIKVILDTTSYATQLLFLNMLMDKGISLQDIYFRLSNKEVMFLQNAQKEHLNPRGKLVGQEESRFVRQIVFNDMLSSHLKHQVLLAQWLDIPLEKIAIVTGRTNNKPIDVQRIQDDFNEEEENQYQIIIGNEKIEVGVDLQNGTQAIHHLTIGWTADSITQRNGRGARQGNHTEKLHAYFYDTLGTFDTHKRTLVQQKHNWIESVKNMDGEDFVIIPTLTNTQKEEMAELMGSSEEEIQRFRERLQQEQLDEELRLIQKRQMELLSLVLSQKQNNQLQYQMNELEKETVQLYEEIMGKSFDEAIALAKIKPEDIPEVLYDLQRAIGENCKYSHSQKTEIKVFTTHFINKFQSLIH